MFGGGLNANMRRETVIGNRLGPLRRRNSRLAVSRKPLERARQSDFALQTRRFEMFPLCRKVTREKYNTLRPQVDDLSEFSPISPVRLDSSIENGSKDEWSLAERFTPTCGLAGYIEDPAKNFIFRTESQCHGNPPGNN